MLNGAHCMRDGLDREQWKLHKAQENVAHSGAYEADEQLIPCGKEERAVKGSSTERGQQNVLATWQKETQREKRRRERNAQRLEGQRREFERKCEARRKAEEGAALGVAAVAASRGSGDAGGDDVARARTQNKGEAEGHSKPEVPRPRGRYEKVPQVQAEREKRTEPPGVGNKTKRRPGGRVRGKADDQKASSNLEIKNGELERSVSPLMTHVAVQTSAVSFASPLNPVTPQGERASPSLGYGGGVHEDAQTSRQSDYLFDPPPQGVAVPGPTLAESAQTREDAVDALFEPPLERSGGSAGTVIPKNHEPTPKGSCSRLRPSGSLARKRRSRSSG